ncbi:MAG: alpha/beta fold hydrolase [Candidatus Pacebacteria bacterium]|nr:alpha/beta fold hydrolase [Candidatus Paceibacterota bacterium]
MNIQPVSISVGSEKLSGLLYIPQNVNNTKFPSVVIFHGRGSNKNRYVDRGEVLVEKGILTLIYDFRGCGESDGYLKKQTIAMGFADAVAGYEFLKNHPLCDKNRLGVLGGSFGGYQAALLSEKYPITSLVLSVPAIYQDKWWNVVPETMDPERKNLYKQQSGLENTKAIRAIRKYSEKILVIEHENDEVIPHKVIEAYYSNASNAKLKEMKIIPNAPHALHDQLFVKQSIDIVVKWFMKTL